MAYFFLIALFALIQALLLNNILLFGVVMPLLYVYFVLLLPRDVKHWKKMCMSFALGLLVDMFCNTPGISSASLTLVAFIQPYILELYMDKEDSMDFAPKISEMGFWRYLSYALFLVLVFCITFFSLEAFTFSNPLQWLASVGGSLVVTLVMILTIDSIRR